MDIATLQRLSARSWPGLEQARLGDWELRAAGGFTARGNSALPIGDPGVGLTEAIRRVGDWYAERGLGPRLQVPAAVHGSGGSGPADEFAAWCDAQGWRAEPWTAVMVREPGTDPEPADLELHWSDRADAAWLKLYHYRAAPLPPVAVRVVEAAPARYLRVVRAGAGIGIGRAAVVDNLVVLTAIEVLEGHRRQGYGTVITEALAADGAIRGATLAALQVFANNGPAVRLYRSLGYRDHHRYRYRVPPVH